MGLTELHRTCSGPDGFRAEGAIILSLEAMGDLNQDIYSNNTEIAPIEKNWKMKLIIC